ncbi:MAG: hypothetical protein II943_09795 [Victivallales bacterium]|nr:hypothetical protein [Victivallales bacterium]
MSSGWYVNTRENLGVLARRFKTLFSPSLLVAWVIAHQTVVTAAELLVCWGNTGDVPAVALLEAGQEPRVLLPGGSADGRMMAWYLERQGMLQVAEMLMPTGAPFPRGSASVAAKCSIRQLTVAQDFRSRLDWGELKRQLTVRGTAVVNLPPVEERCWRTTMGGWVVTYRKGDNGTFHLEIAATSDNGATAFCCEERLTGVFAVMSADGGEPLLEVPKSNRSGARRVPLEIAPGKSSVSE